MTLTEQVLTGLAVSIAAYVLVIWLRVRFDPSLRARQCPRCGWPGTSHS